MVANAGHEPEREPEQELRLALAMSGGVSLAVWIGGACSEIDLLRRATSAADGDLWRALLTMSGHERVLVDVFAGASAGGLNAVLFAASQLSGFPFSAVKEVWLTAGSTEQLVRRGADPESIPGADEPRWPSLFRGDGHFLDIVQTKLGELTARGADPSSPAPPKPADSIDVRLAATHVEPIVRAVPGAPGEGPISVRRYGTGFTFRRSAYPFASDNLSFRSGDDPARSLAVAKLALAGRSSSSYPVAFEAAAVRSPRPETFSSGPGSPGTVSQPNMHGAFNDSRTPNGSGSTAFLVSDGGILDNLPIRRAMDAIAAAPASSTTRRELLFLEPSAVTPLAPPGTPAAMPATDPTPLGARRSTVAVLKGVFGAYVAEETIAEDVTAIERHNEAIKRADATRLARFATVPDRAALLAEAEASLARYRIERSHHDARLVTQLLADPISLLGRDPFPQTFRTERIDEPRWRSPITGWSPSAREELEGDLQRLLLVPDGSLRDALVTGARPLVRVTSVLIQWAQFIERAGDDTTRAGAGALKASLYRVLALLDVGLDEPRRLGWVAEVVATGAPTAGVEGHLTAIHTRLARLSKTTTDRDDLCRALVDTSEKHDVLLTELVDERGRYLDLPLEAPEDELGATDLRDVAVEALVQLANRLRAIAPPPLDEPSKPRDLLHNALTGPTELTAETLAALEVVCFGEFVAGFPGHRRVQLRRLSAGNRTPIAEHFTTLLGPLDPADPLDSPSLSPPPDSIPVERKLAGDELFHFSAFLLERWRANDWLWGRLDAVPTLVDVLATPDAVRRWLDLADADRDADPISRIKRLVVPPNGEWAAFLDERVWAPNAEAIAVELATSADTDQQFVAIRRALIARRQWEIIADETGRPPDQLIGWANAYDVGAEMIAGNRSSDELVDRFEELVADAGLALVSNLEVAAPGKVPNLAKWALLRGSSAGGRLLGRFLTRPTGTPAPRPSLTKPVLAVAGGIVVISAVAGAIGGWPFGLGMAAGATLTIAVPAGALVYLSRREPEEQPLPPLDEPTT